MNDPNGQRPGTAHDLQGDQDVKPKALHQEGLAPSPPTSKWKLSKTGDGDTAMALFDRPDALEEPVDPAEEKKLIRRIDFMILPYLAVCYAFFYIGRYLFFT